MTMNILTLMVVAERAAEKGGHVSWGVETLSNSIFFEKCMKNWKIEASVECVRSIHGNYLLGLP